MAFLRAVPLDAIGLVMACPRKQDNPRECPLFELRQRSIAERMRYLDAASKEHVAAIMGICRDCRVARSG